MSKTIKLAAAAAALFAALPLSAEAMPIAPAASAAAGVTLVAGGCGPGFHRGPFLGCRPNRPFVRPFAPIVRRPVVCRTVLLPLPHRVCR
ncbi:GCG_CRPN prefix-to-repeats domain-containing protein [Lichenibacterium dinghuense]|uniref:GCG_CRPN prefix-to-repeats domain-containing protein n=1 Tax=Lichenibacterium dinghuense TaxID=2895977 RepID=UPI001F3CEEE9|nr:hypothetical protein [Lichenibacterium sp. 6Y81]